MGCPLSTNSGTVKIIERFGKFSRVTNPGLDFLICPCCCVDAVASTVSMRVQQIDVRCETKTKDNVFVKMDVSVQYQVMKTKVRESHYELTSVQQQIRAYIFDVVRSEVPKLILDDLYTMKDALAVEIKKGVADAMGSFGYLILATPITDIDPNEGVKAAMNEINKQERLKKAASDKGEAAKILMVKQAEAVAAKIRIESRADADAKEQAGDGLSRQRLAIIRGLQQSVKEFTGHVEGMSSSTVMDMIMITQYFDTLEKISQNSSTNTVFIPNGPGALKSLGDEMRQGILEAQAVGMGDKVSTAFVNK